MKSLKTIQSLSKLGKILSKIMFICCIVGICGCLVGALGMLLGDWAVKIRGMTLHSFLQTEAGVLSGTIWAAILTGILLCAGELVVSRMACRYFTHELAAGTPFTQEGAKELLRLGVYAVAVPVGTTVLAQIACELVQQFAPEAQKLHLDGSDGITLGVMFIVLSLFCRYGADLQSSPTQEK